MSSTKVNTRVIQRGRTRNIKSWSDAVDVAEKKLEQAYAQVARLRRSIAILKDFRDSGEPWPGTSEVMEKVTDRAL